MDLRGRTDRPPTHLITGGSLMADKINWMKSTKSSDNGNCVEVALDDDGRVLVRGSKDPDGPVLHFDRSVWWEFLDGAHNYEFDF